LRRSERIIFLVLAAVSLGLRLLAFSRYQFDSDEPQHLHVTWGWTAGLVQYRDVFDNHTPLFHMITAPILRAFGERADILLYMRGPMLVLFAIVIACTYIAGRAMDSRRAGAWAALMLSMFPPFFLKSLEYRSDNPWNALWMVAFVLMLSAPHTVTSALLIGLLFGAALAASIKLALLIIASAVALLIVRRIEPRAALAALGGALIVPAAILLYFARLGALDDLIFGVVGFNSVLAESRTLVWTGRIVYPFAIAAIFFAARRFRDAEPRRLFAGVDRSKSGDQFGPAAPPDM
jgi:4-amino-4-deoxy-L-arabinose transferase-like glycosyltransferase